MKKALNPWGRREFPAVAAQGQGVLETFVAVVQEMLAAIAVKYNLKEKGLDPATIPDVVGEAFNHLMKEAAAAGPPPPPTAKPQGKVIVSQSTNVDHAAPLQATPETGLVSEELLHRAIRSNVELAEALAGLVQSMNVGLGTILSHAELLMMYREDAREKRQGAITSIQQEATRLRKIMQDLGQAGLAAGSAPPPPRAPVAPPPRAAAPTPAAPAPPPAAAPVAPAAPAAPAGPPLEPALREALAAAAPTTDPRQVAIELRIPTGTALPRVQPQTLHKATVSLLDGISIMSPSGSTAVLRSEKKPVLLRGKDGQQVKRDFLMLAVSHGGALSAEDQQRILQGGDTCPLGEACRLVREMGGFAPLPAGGLETRLFLPA
jgi:hypothetical protein